MKDTDPNTVRESTKAHHKRIVDCYNELRKTMGDQIDYIARSRIYQMVAEKTKYCYRLVAQVIRHET